MPASSNGSAPITPVEFEILLALADTPRHGYAIMQEIAERSRGAVSVRPGTLYRAIDRMLQVGMLQEVKDRPEAGEDQRRRYYRLTESGRRIAMAEARRLAEAVASARSKKLLPSARA